MSQRKAKTKYDDIPLKTWVALAKKLGGRKVVDGILNGSVKFTINCVDHSNQPRYFPRQELSREERIDQIFAPFPHKPPDQDMR
ncbi:MAG: hypothetical protein WCT08_03960 [Patescibacteria group bacterium]|jgi:hypothetical protein